MMRIDEALRAYLLADAPLTAMVGTRIYPMTYPQNGTLPAVVYQQISSVPYFAHDGEMGSAEAHFYISAFSTNYGQAHDVANTVKTALKPLMDAPGMMGDVPVAGIQPENEIDVSALEEFEPLGAYHVLAEYLLMVDQY
jgi:hypothetical protein